VGDIRYQIVRFQISFAAKARKEFYPQMDADLKRKDSPQRKMRTQSFCHEGSNTQKNMGPQMDGEGGIYSF